MRKLLYCNRVLQLLRASGNPSRPINTLLLMSTFTKAFALLRVLPLKSRPRILRRTRNNLCCTVCSKYLQHSSNSFLSARNFLPGRYYITYCGARSTDMLELLQHKTCPTEIIRKKTKNLTCGIWDQRNVS